MGNMLRAVVIGAGWAGEGHTLALRHAGVDVVAICARRSEVVQRVAERLQIPEASIDWRGTLANHRPDIVALTTPAALRGEVIERAADMGAHILCEKPLATTASEAKRLFEIVQQAGVKHAYAATHRYDPSVLWLRELLERGTIGSLWEILMTVRTGFPRPMPWSWMRTLADGGGVLNNLLPHLLGILERIANGRVVQATGHARTYVSQAPVVPGIHDFREWLRIGRQLKPEELQNLEWRPCDADDAFWALLTLQGDGAPISCTVLYGPGQPVPGELNGIRLFGDQGTLIGQGVIRFSVTHVRPGVEEAAALEVPARLEETLPQVGDDIQNKWCALARDFVADVRGQPHAPYLTFWDGWRYQEIIEAIRHGQSWADIPAQPERRL